MKPKSATKAKAKEKGTEENKEEAGERDNKQTRATPVRASPTTNKVAAAPVVALPPLDLNLASIEDLRARLPKTSKLADAIVGECNEASCTTGPLTLC